ncbi:MAG: UvrD-helicase domain-containing protein, partial [Bacteroidales bacterium]|nr:UvrD-helicase domain-containing protein [Bacteroidales bacterium]
LLNNTIEDNGKIDIDHVLLEALKIIYGDTEGNYEYLKKLAQIDIPKLKEKINGWREALRTLPEAFLKNIQSIAQEGATAAQDVQQHMLSKCSTFFTDVQANYAQYVKGNAKINATLMKMSAGDCFKKSGDGNPKVEAARPVISDCFDKILAALKSTRREYVDSLILLKHSDKLIVLFDLQAAMEKIKQLNNLFLLTESNPLIYEEIKGDETPVIFEKMNYNHYFIDEFQDTSKMQWANIKPLIQNRALDQDGDVTLFGDVKQAIYRFRNGDVNLFYQLGKYETCRMSEFGFPNIDDSQYENVVLADNYRSAKSVVEFNNAFFQGYAEKLDMSDFYQDVKQNVKNSAPGLVTTFIYSAENDVCRKMPKAFEKDETFAEFFNAHKDDLSIKDVEILFAVEDALARGYRYGDIAILFSGNDKCSHVADLLLNAGMKVITEKSLTLNASAEVNLIIHTLEYLLHPNDILAQSTILFYLSKIKHKEHVFQDNLLKINPDLKKNQDAANGPEKLQFTTILEKNFGEAIPIAKWISEPLFIVVKEIIRFYQLEENKSPFIIDFENYVLNYLQNKNGEISKFLTWWNQSIVIGAIPSLTLPSGQNAIRVSTIHKSKGLEYPVVIMQYSTKGNKPHSTWTNVANDDMVAYIELSQSKCADSSYEQQAEEERVKSDLDTINLLYVAHTRAKEMLYIISKHNKNIGTGYGDQLFDFVQKHDAADDSGIIFEKDQTDDRICRFGKKDWRNPKENQEFGNANAHMAEPMIVTSGFLYNETSSQMAGNTLSDNSRRLIGIGVHDYLSKLIQFPQNEDEIEPLVQQVPEEQRDTLRSAFQRILQDDAIKPYFFSFLKVLNETTILDSNGDEYRPDRIVFFEDKVVVIDYKTGKENPKYQEQIDKYMGLLHQMGYEQVEGVLLYV